jgi:hypothetical protein
MGHCALEKQSTFHSLRFHHHAETRTVISTEYRALRFGNDADFVGYVSINTKKPYWSLVLRSRL